MIRFKAKADGAATPDKANEGKSGRVAAEGDIAEAAVASNAPKLTGRKAGKKKTSDDSGDKLI